MTASTLPSDETDSGVVRAMAILGCFYMWPWHHVGQMGLYHKVLITVLMKWIQNSCLRDVAVPAIRFFVNY